MLKTTNFPQLVLAAGAAGLFFTGACRESRNFGPCEDDDTCPGMIVDSGNAMDGAVSGGMDSSVGSTQGVESTSGGAISAVDSGTAALGEACDEDEECALGFCVDRVCCQTACTEVCSRCDVPGSEGTCSAVEEDAACGELHCPPNTECRSFVPWEGPNCAALGECQSEVECVEVVSESGTSCRDGEGTCEGGECVVPDKLVLGDPCAQAEECGSGICVPASDGVERCCELACDGLCEVCSVDGRCDAVPADDSDCPVVSCSSSTGCTVYPDDLTSNRCAARGRCESEATHCVPTNQPSGQSCGSGLACDDAGNCVSVCAESQLWCGGTCVDPASNNNYCGASGFCEGGQAGNRCTGGEQCVNGTCRLPTASICSTNSQCASNSCLTFYRDVDGDGFGALSSGTARFCTSSPSTEYVANNTDCCDVADNMAHAKEVNTSYTGGLRDYGAVGCAEPFDWDCSKTLTKGFSVNKGCPSFTSSATCPGVLFQNDPPCGVPSSATACGWDTMAGVCTNARGAMWTQTCY